MNKQELEQKIEELRNEFERKVTELQNQVNQLPKEKIWKPKKDEKFYYIDSRGDVGESVFNCEPHEQKVRFGNYYKNQEQAEFAAQRQKYTNLYRKYVEENSDPLDWDNWKQRKYYLIYEDDLIKFDFSNRIRQQGVIYSPNQDVLQKALDFIGRDNMKRYILGVVE